MQQHYFDMLAVHLKRKQSTRKQQYQYNKRQVLVKRPCPRDVWGTNTVWFFHSCRRVRMATSRLKDWFEKLLISDLCR